MNEYHLIKGYLIGAEAPFEIFEALDTISSFIGAEPKRTSDRMEWTNGELKIINKGILGNAKPKDIHKLLPLRSYPTFYNKYVEIKYKEDN